MLTKKQIAEHYGVSTACIRNWEKEGMPAHRRPGIRKPGYIVVEVDKWLLEREEKKGGK